MNNRALFSAFAAAFALSACDSPTKPAVTAASPAVQPPPAAVISDASAQAKPGRKHPNAHKCQGHGNCVVKVTVVDCASGNLTVDYPDMAIPTGLTHEEIRWDIVGNDYVFTKDGVKFKDPVAAAKEFSNPRANGDKFTWHDANEPNPQSPERDYPYTVTVTPKKGGAGCKPYDPIIINDY